MMIRQAVTEDIERMAELSDAKRTEYSKYSPVFWRKAEGASEMQSAFFRSQLERDNNIVLIAEKDGTVEGFVIASVIGAPPVYEPGGPVCLIDDFTVSRQDLWETIGAALLSEVRARARSRGAVLTVTVCANLDEPKRSMLMSTGSEIASEWYVGPV